MADRYSRISAIPANQYAAGSPVILEAGALLRDNKTGSLLAQLKFRNVSTKGIKLLTVEVQSLDAMGRELGTPVRHQYLDLQAGRNSSFGSNQTVTLPDASTRDFRVRILETGFTDNTLSGAVTAPWEALPAPIPISVRLNDSELEKQYHLHYNKAYKYESSRFHNLWYCPQGHLNQAEETACYTCSAPFLSMNEIDLEALNQEKTERLAAEAKQREERLAREKAEQEEWERKKQAAAAQAAIRRKRNTKIAILAGTAAAVVIAAILFFTKVIKPTAEKEIRYRHANTLLKDGNFEEAKSVFLSLEDYRKAQENALEADYRKAEMHLKQEEFEVAIGIWESISTYSNSTERIEQALYLWKDTDYQRAVFLVEQGQYEEAVQIFAELGDYQDSAAKQQNAQMLQNQQVYLLAEECMDNGQYKNAIEYFEYLGNFNDAPTRAEAACYAYGVELMQTENYDAAAAQFHKAANYLDAEELYAEAVYQFGDALLQKEDYAGAITQFSICQNHSDAPQKLLQAKFQYVTEHKEDPDQKAKTFLDELVEAHYKDSQKLYNEVYAWKATIVGIGTDHFDNHTINKQIGRPSEVWCTWTLSGGALQKTIDVYVMVRAANGQTLRQNFSKCESGKSYLVQLYGLSPNMTAGNITFTIYQQDGTMLTSESTYWG